MNNNPFDNYDRTELAPYLGQEICFTGLIVNTSAPTPTTRYVCLRNVRLAVRDDDVKFDDRPQIKMHHIWLDVSETTHVKSRLAMEVVGCGTVVAYKRKDGTHSYCLRFIERGHTEISLMGEFAKKIEVLRTTVSSLSLAEQHEAFRKLLKITMDYIESGRVCFHYYSKSEFIKYLERRRGDLMNACGVYLPNNRAGRRCQARSQRHKVHRSLCLKGFG